MPLHLAERDATAFLVHSRRGNEQRATAKNFFREQQPITISSTSMN